MYETMNLNLACELKEMLSCRSIDIGSLKNAQMLKKKSYELMCDEECFINERNRNMAQALQLDPNAKPKVIYSDFLKNYAREEPAFLADLEKRFEAIVNYLTLSLSLSLPCLFWIIVWFVIQVKEIKVSKLSKKAFNLPVMKSFERKFIHELAHYYGFETISHDPEPNRNVCIYASRDKCAVPVPTLMQSIEVKTKQSTMSRLSNLKQLNQTASNPIQSNLKVLQYQEPAEYLALSSMFSALVDQETEDIVIRKDAADKNIDYFDMTN